MILHFILNFTLFFTTRFIMDLFKQILWQLPVSRMSLYHLSWIFSWRSLLVVALNLAENRPQGAWRRSALCDVPVFNFMYYVNLRVQRCIQGLVKHRRRSFFVKGVNGSWSLTVFVKNPLLGCLSSECASGVF